MSTSGTETTSATFRAVVIDDEPLAIEGIRRLCGETGRVEVIGEAADGKAGLKLIEELRPEVVFLDIAMPGRTGLEVAAELKTWEKPPLVVLITAYDHFATEAFDLAVVDYVLKPIVPERLARAIDRTFTRLSASEPDPADGDNTFWLPYRGSVVRLAEVEIRRLEAERDYVRFVAADRSFLLRATLNEMQTRLDSARFVRIHRSTIMAAAQVVGVRHVGAGAWVAIDSDGTQFPIGRSYLDEVRHRLGLKV